MLRFATVSVESFAPAHLPLRVNLRLISRAAALAAWLPSLGQTLHFPRRRRALALVFLSTKRRPPCAPIFSAHACAGW